MILNFLKVIDSFAKPPTGILKGSVNWLGDFDECIESVNNTKNIQTKYCTISKNQNPSPSKTSFLFKYGICPPKNCTSQDIAKILNFSKIFFLKIHF